MATTRFLTYPVFQAFDDNGNPLSGGKVNVYSEGTTDRIDTWTDANQNTKNANPVILNSRGEADIWFDAPAKIVLTDSADVTVKTIDSVSPLNSQTLTGKYNLLENGSFELDGDGDGQPDSWDIVETDGSSTVEIDTSTVAHGSNSLKFVSGSGGGGTATTSEKFPVADGESFGVSFFVASTATTATNKVDVIFYDSAGTNPSTSNVYTSSGTSPSSLTRKSTAVTVPANKTQAEVKLTGVDNAVTATTYFDFVQALDQGYIFTGTAGEVTVDAAELNILSGVTTNLTSTELNTLDGFTGNTTDLNSIDAAHEHWELLSTETPSGASQVDLSLSGSFDRYKVVFRKVTSSSSGADTFMLRTSADGGNTFDSGASDYRYEFDNFSSNGEVTGDSEIELLGGVFDVRGIFGEAIVEYLGDDSETDDLGKALIFVRAHNNTNAGLTSGAREANEEIDTLRFFFNSGNVSATTFKLYGWKDGA